MRNSIHKRWQILFFLLVIVSFFSLNLTKEASAAKSNSVRLKLVTYLSPAYGDIFYNIQRMADYIGYYGGKHNLKAKVYHSQTVYKAKEMLQACISGSIDIAILMGPSMEGSIPVFGGSGLPFIWGDIYTQREGSRRGSPFFNLVSEECEKKNLVLLAMPSTEPEEFISRKPLRTIEDFRGIKIRTTGAMHAFALKAIGAVPVSMSSSEIYTSLQRGVIEASMGLGSTFIARKLFEIAKYQTNINCFLFDWVAIMNKDRYLSLSKEQKNVILNAAELYRHDHSVTELVGGYMHVRDILIKEHGVEEIYLPESELTKFREAMSPVKGWWKKRVGVDFGNKVIKAIEDSHNWRKSRYGKLDFVHLK